MSFLQEEYEKIYGSLNDKGSSADHVFLQKAEQRLKTALEGHRTGESCDESEYGRYECICAEEIKKGLGL